MLTLWWFHSQVKLYCQLLKWVPPNDTVIQWRTHDWITDMIWSVKMYISRNIPELALSSPMYLYPFWPAHWTEEQHKTCIMQVPWKQHENKNHEMWSCADSMTHTKTVTLLLLRQQSQLQNTMWPKLGRNQIPNTGNTWPNNRIPNSRIW